jgi:hypothetical protein
MQCVKIKILGKGLSKHIKVTMPHTKMKKKLNFFNYFFSPETVEKLEKVEKSFGTFIWGRGYQKT